jgi:hypothetical protein
MFAYERGTVVPTIHIISSPRLGGWTAGGPADIAMQFHSESNYPSIDRIVHTTCRKGVISSSLEVVLVVVIFIVFDSIIKQ